MAKERVPFNKVYSHTHICFTVNEQGCFYCIHVVYMALAALSKAFTQALGSGRNSGRAKDALVRSPAECLGHGRFASYSRSRHAAQPTKDAAPAAQFPLLDYLFSTHVPCPFLSPGNHIRVPPSFALSCPLRKWEDFSQWHNQFTTRAPHTHSQP